MEKQIEFLIDGQLVGSSYLTIEDGQMFTEAAEEKFYKVLRHSSTDLIEEEREYLIDNLTKAQQEKLQEASLKDYHGAKDDWEVYFENWLMELSLTDLKKQL